MFMRFPAKHAMTLHECSVFVAETCLLPPLKLVQAHALPHVNSNIKSNVNIRATQGASAAVFWILEWKELN